MNSDFQHSVKIGLSIYGINILLTVIVHLIFAWNYPHDLPTSSTPLFLTLVVAGQGLLLTALMTMAEKSHIAKGELIVHIGGTRRLTGWSGNRKFSSKYLYKELKFSITTQKDCVDRMELCFVNL